MVESLIIEALCLVHIPKLIMVTSNGFLCMIHFLVIEQRILIVFVFDIIFYHNLFNTFCGLVVFIVVFDI